MITPELIDFIKQQLSAGMTRGEITQILLDNEWKSPDVNEAFASLEPKPVTPLAPAPSGPMMPQPIAAMPVSSPIVAETKIEVRSPEIEPVTIRPVAQPLSQPMQSSPMRSDEPLARFATERPVARPIIQETHIYSQPVVEAAPQMKPQPQMNPPMQSVRQPQMQPQMQQTVAPAQGQVTFPSMAPVQPTQPAMEKHPFRNPSWLLALVSLVIVSVLGGIVILSKLPATTGAGAMHIAAVVGFFVASFIGGVILNWVTKVFRMEDATLPKALVFMSMQMFVALILNFVLSVGISGLVVFILGIIVWFGLFASYYQVGFFKTLGAFILDIIFSIIFAAIIGGVAFLAGFSVFKYFMPSPAAPYTIPIVVGAESGPEAPQAPAPAAQTPAAPVDTTKMSEDSTQIKTILNSLKIQASLYAKDHKGSYGTPNTKPGDCAGSGAGSFFTSASAQKLLKDISKTYPLVGSPRCEAKGVAEGDKVATAWAVAAALPTGESYCVDSMGFMGNTDGVSIAASGQCTSVPVN